MHHATNAPLAVQQQTPGVPIPDWVSRSGGALSLGSRVLYGVLMARVHDGDGWDGLEELQDDMGVSTRTIRKYLRELQDFGAVEVTGRGRNADYLIRFNVPTRDGSVR